MCALLRDHMNDQASLGAGVEALSVNLTGNVIFELQAILKI